MDNCKVCHGTIFYKEAGYYFCSECQTKNEERREAILEQRYEGTRITQRKIAHDNSEKTEQSAQWSTWELYNFVLIGLTDELIELGASSDIKLTVLRLWAFYLGKVEVAFTSKTRRKVPKLARCYHKRDADIIYGKLKSRKRKRSRASSASSIISSQLSEGSSNRELSRHKRLLYKAEYERLVSSQTGSESDAFSLVSQSLASIRSGGSQSSVSVEKLKYSKHAKGEAKRVKKLSKKLPRAQRVRYQQKHVTTKYRTGPYVITPMKLWAILYLALRIHDQSIHLADMLRYGREGHLSYYRLDHLLPAEISLTETDVKFLTQNNEITHKGMRRTCAEMAKFLFVSEISCPDFAPLIERYCTDLSLPKGILIYVKRLVALSSPMMIFNYSEPLIPNYEGRAMGFIIVVLKMLLGMDGITEYEISRIAEKINSKLQKKTCNNIPTSELGVPPRRKSVMERLTTSICEPVIETLDLKKKYCIIVHGGCGQCSDMVMCEKLDGCKKAASRGYKKMMDGGSALDAVEAALWWLECDEFFNCGYGSVLNRLGDVQMDASIMDGDRFEIGSVAAVSDIEHPISLAKFVLENYPNTIMVGDGAKKLSRCTDMRWISEGNMVSPKAILALHSSSNRSADLEYDVADVQSADLLTKSWGTTGCVAWDGRSMAAGTTTGGVNGKMVGRIGDSPFLGCGTFANNLAGCSMTGHGETIAKLGLSRKIVEEVTADSCPEDTLKLNIDAMYQETNCSSGGIVLKNNGCWGIHFSTPRMPYAVVKKNFVTFGAEPSERKTVKYFDPDNSKTMADDESNSKLFSFGEWQRYIECRRNVLMSKHFPTKFKNDSDAFGSTGVYVKFIKSALSRREDKPEITDYKNCIPRELANVMEQCIAKLGENSQYSEDVEVFAPSSTPQHSYIEQLLQHPMYDLPDILRCNFSDTKVFYMIKPEKIVEIAAEFGIRLQIENCRLHFVHKLVSQFEKQRLPSLAELNKSVTVTSCSEKKKKHVETGEDLSFYLEKQNAQALRLSRANQSYYDSVQTMVVINNEGRNSYAGKSIQRSDLQEDDEGDLDFGFRNVTRDGKLLIPSSQYSDSGNESVDNSANEMEETFRKKYNLNLSGCVTTNGSYVCPDEENIRVEKLQSMNGKKKELVRDSNGRFVQKNSPRAIKKPAIRKSLSSVSPKIQSHDLRGIGVGHNPSEVRGSWSFETSCVSESDSDSLEKLFVPFKDYWMYHCIFSRVKPKNFDYFETELPVSFQWLLNECSDVVEMSTEDLYEQVCLIETYFAHLLRADNIDENVHSSKAREAKLRQCRKKW